MFTPRPASGLRRFKVLVIDDDVEVVSLLKVRLGKLISLVGTTDPFQAVPLAQAEQPDAILCDINMPGRNGDEVVLALSQDELTRDIPVIYLTSLLTPRQTTELGETFGGHVGISKDAPTAQLLALIESVVAE